MNNKDIYIDVNTGKSNKKINMKGGSLSYKEIVDYLLFGEETITIDGIEYNEESLLIFIEDIYKKMTDLSYISTKKEIIKKMVLNKKNILNESIKSYIQEYINKKQVTFFGIRYSINSQCFNNIETNNINYDINARQFLYYDLESIVYIYQYYKDYIFLNENLQIYNLFNKINNTIFENEPNNYNAEQKEDYEELQKKRLQIFFNIKFETKFYKNINNYREIKDIIKKLIIIFTSNLPDKNILQNKYYKYIYENSNINTSKEIINKYNNYNKFFDYLNNYSEQKLDEKKTWLEITNNTFKLDISYNFINKLVKSNYNEASGLTVYNKLLELIDTDSKFLTNRNLFNELNAELSLFNKLSIIFNKIVDLKSINEIIQKLKLQNKYYFNIDLKSKNQYENLVNIYKILIIYKNEQSTDKDRTKYYDNIYKFFTTYLDINEKLLYEILNSINNNDSVKSSMEKLKEYITNMNFLYDNTNNTEFDIIKSEVKPFHLINKLKNFTQNINNDEYFNIEKMSDVINNFLKINDKEKKISKINFNKVDIYTNIDNQYQDIIKSITSPIEKFIVLYNTAKKDILTNMTPEDFYNLLLLYINAFRKTKITQIDINDICKNDIIIPNKMNEYIDYNKSFNKKFNYNKNNNLLINFINFIHTNKTKLNIDNEIIKIKKNQLYVDINFEDLFTDKQIEIKDFFKEKMYNNICITNKLKDTKKISGIKLLLNIFECNDTYNINLNDNEFNRIYLYITKNTKESNSKYLIKEKKLNSILDKLKVGECNDEIKYIKNMINKKKHIPTDINELLQTLNINNIDDTQKYKQIYLYNLLLSYSPPNIDLTLNKLVFDYINSKTNNIVQNINTKTWMSTFKTIFNLNLIVKNIQDFTNINLTNFEDFIDNQMRPLYGIHWKIYLYFNFDHQIIDINRLNKIILILKSNNDQIKLQDYKDDDDDDDDDDNNLINILKKIINSNLEQLEKIDKKNNLLDLFIKNKWKDIDNLKTNNEYPNKYLLENLYDILFESANQSYLTLNGLEYIKNKFSNITSINYDENNENNYDNIINKLLICSNNLYITKSDYENIFNKLKDIIIKIENGEASEDEIKEIINFTKTCNEYIKNNQSYKIFIDTYNNKQSRELEYDEQYKFYDILYEICKTDSFISTIQTNIIETGKEQIKESITNYAKEKIIDLGINVDNLSKIIDKATTAAKYVAGFAAGAYALSLGYKIVNNLLNDKDKAYTEKQLKLSKIFKEDEEIIINNLVYIYNDKQSVFNKVSSFIKKKYIKFQISINNLPDPEIDSKLLDNIINKHINNSIILKGGSINLSDIKRCKELLKSNLIGGSFAENMFDINNTNKDEEKDKHTIIINMLNNIYEDISKLLGFDNNISINRKTKSFTDVYSHLKYNFDYDPHNIFKGVELNEHPDQIKIIERLKRIYNNFMKITQNQPFDLKKKEKTKIKKMIAEIVNLEINMFKQSNQYTFVYALKNFFNE